MSFRTRFAGRVKPLKIYLLSAAAGLLVGVIYALLHVRSPAPPVVALVGLLGILVGEQAVPVVKRWITKEPVTVGWLRETCGDHVFGELPRAARAPDASQGERS